MDPSKIPEIKIVTLAQKALKIGFFKPYERLSRKQNLCLAFLGHCWILANCIPNAAVIVYQVMIGIEDVYALVESFIVIVDYVSAMYLCVCYTSQMHELDRVMNDIGIFLEFCDISVIKDAENYIHFGTKCVMIYFFLGVLFYGLLPVLNITSCRESRTLEFYQKYDPCGNMTRNLYPFDTRGMLRTILVNVSKAITAFFICFGCLGPPMGFAGLFVHVVAQIKSLKLKILTLCKEPQEEEQMIANFRTCVRYHITILSFARRIFAAYSALMLFHITITPVMFGLISFYIFKLEYYGDKLRQFGHLTGWMAMLFVTCYFGQRVTDESTSIADEAYSSFWYKAPVSLQKSVRLMIIQAQRPLVLQAASFRDISLDTFVAVLKGAYSFFTLMVTVSD